MPSHNAIQPWMVDEWLSCLAPQKLSSRARMTSAPTTTVPPPSQNVVNWLFEIAPQWNDLAQLIRWDLIRERFPILRGDWVTVGNAKFRLVNSAEPPIRLSVINPHAIELKCEIEAKGTGWLTQFVKYRITGITICRDNGTVHASGLLSSYVVPFLVWS